MFQRYGKERSTDHTSALTSGLGDKKHIFSDIVHFPRAHLFCFYHSPFERSGIRVGDEQTSPYSLALQHAGWAAAPNLINTFIFTAVFSSINSCNYIASRTLLPLAQLGRAPKIFARTTSRGVPMYAVIVTNTLGLIALINTGTGAGAVFTYLVTISGSATFIAWAFIGITHLHFRRAWKLQGRLANELPFQAWLYPWGTYFVVALNVFLGVHPRILDSVDSLAAGRVCVQLYYSGAVRWTLDVLEILEAVQVC